MWSSAAAVAAAAAEAFVGRRGPPPLLRSRTLPAIIAPGFSILHAQIDPQRTTGKLLRTRTLLIDINILCSFSSFLYYLYD